jgi:hypothetical protein
MTDRTKPGVAFWATVVPPDIAGEGFEAGQGIARPAC